VALGGEEGLRVPSAVWPLGKETTPMRRSPMGSIGLGPGLVDGDLAGWTKPANPCSIQKGRSRSGHNERIYAATLTA
jgi:hypothetical protein